MFINRKSNLGEFLPDYSDDKEKVTNCSNDRNKPVKDEENDLNLRDEDDVLLNNPIAVILATVIGVVGVIHPIIYHTIMYV